MSVKSVLIIAPYTILPGEKGFGRFTYIADRLARRGHEVTLVTSGFNHPEKAARSRERTAETFAGLPYSIRLLDEPGYRSNIGIERIRSHRVFERSLRLYLKERNERTDVVYAAYPLMASAKDAGVYAKEKKVPFILDIQDIWPESINTVLNLPDWLIHPLLYPISRYADDIYRKADHIIGVSETYTNRGRKGNPGAASFHSVFIGTELETFDRCSRVGMNKPPGEFWLTYIGTLSYSYDVGTVIKAVALLHSCGYDMIRFKILGSGPMEQEWKTLAVRLGAPVDFMGYRTYEEMAPVLVYSDAAANAISKGSKASITNKIGDYLSAGLPVLNSCGNAELRELITANGIGLHYEPGNYRKLAEQIEFLYRHPDKAAQMGGQARELAERRFDRGVTYETIYRLIEQAGEG